MTRTKSADHTKMFAPIFICIFFGLAIVGAMQIFMPTTLGISNNGSGKEMNFAYCTRVPGSVILEKYPPTCVTPEGKVYEKPLPAVKLP